MINAILYLIKINNFIVRSFLFFCFLVGGLWFMDCRRPSAFAMTNWDENSKFFFFSVFVLTFWGLWIASLCSQWQYPHTVIARAWKARGNLCMGYNYWFIEFFCFSVFVFIISGLWGLPPFVRGDVAKQQGGWEKIENWKLKINSLVY